MPKPSLRSRSKKRSALQLPGGRAGTRYGRGKIKSSRCSKCGRMLSGAPSLVPSKIRRLSAGQRKVERPFGSLLCSSCLRGLLKQSVRSG